MTDRGERWFLLFDVAKIDTALGKLSDHDLAKRTQVIRIVRAENDLVFLLNDLCFRVLEIEARGQLFSRLIESVVDFLFIDFGNDIERRHG